MPSVAGTIYTPRLNPFSSKPLHQEILSHLLGNTIVPLNTLDPPGITSPRVQVHTRVVGVILPAAQQIARANAAVARLAAEEVPRPGGEVDGVAGVVHGHVDIVVAFVLVGGGALGTD